MKWDNNILWSNNLFSEILWQYVRDALFRSWAVDGRSSPSAEADHWMESEKPFHKYIIDEAECNGRVAVVRDIAHMNFPLLTVLHLDRNQIESIEGLPYVYMPQIKSLLLGRYGGNIGGNNITSVRVVRLAAWPALQILSMGTRVNNADRNYFKDARRLTEGNFSELRALHLCYPLGETQNKFPELVSPSKMQTTSLKYLSTSIFM